MIYGMPTPSSCSSSNTRSRIPYLCRRQNPASTHYDHRLIASRLSGILCAREDQDLPALVGLLRSGLVRNLGNITASSLYDRALAGTKLLIEDYVTHVALAIELLAAIPTTSEIDAGAAPINAGAIPPPRSQLTPAEGAYLYPISTGVAALERMPPASAGLTSQAKLDLLHDTRQAFGRTALVLQGGAIFGLCHIGVVKALHLRGLLPRIIGGTATGALIAALVGIHAEDELLGVLNGAGIDLSAFEEARNRRTGESWLTMLSRRLARFVKEGHLLDVRVLEDCVRRNVGDATFEEAYARTKRVLNITISTSGEGGVPNLLNYLTAPNVVCPRSPLSPLPPN